jgi:hypothetical protein
MRSYAAAAWPIIPPPRTIEHARSALSATPEICDRPAVHAINGGARPQAGQAAFLENWAFVSPMVFAHYHA